MEVKSSLYKGDKELFTKTVKNDEPKKLTEAIATITKETYKEYNELLNTENPKEISK